MNILISLSRLPFEW